MIWVVQGRGKAAWAVEIRMIVRRLLAISCWLLVRIGSSPATKNQQSTTGSPSARFEFACTVSPRSAAGPVKSLDQPCQREKNSQENAHDPLKQ
jgi:hypothetical protein